MKARIGTRGSKLALWQAELVKDKLVNSNIEAELSIYTTKGDLRTDVPLHKIGDKGLFTTALDDALLNGEIDIAVHSAKDMPSEMPAELELVAVLKREDPRDVLLAMSREVDLDNVSASFVIGTSSMRRTAFLQHYVPGFEVKVIRGNVDTRINKMKRGEYDGIVLAYAGVKRMGYTHLVVRKLNVTTFTPAIGQGAIGVVARKDSKMREEFRAALNHLLSEQALECERAYMRKMEGGCHIPIFGLATITGETLSFRGGIAAVDGSEIIRESMDGKVSDAAGIGTRLAEIVINKGGKRLLHG